MSTTSSSMFSKQFLSTQCSTLTALNQNSVCSILSEMGVSKYMKVFPSWYKKNFLEFISSSPCLNFLRVSILSVEINMRWLANPLYLLYLTHLSPKNLLNMSEEEDPSEHWLLRLGFFSWILGWGSKWDT